MAEGEVSFKSAMKKFVKTTNFLGEFQNNESFSESEINLKEPVEILEKLPICDNLNKNIKWHRNDSDTIERKQIFPYKEKLRGQYFQDREDSLIEQIDVLKFLVVTEKNSSVRNVIKNTPLKLESSVQVENFTNYTSETADNLEFFNEIKTEYFNKKASETEQFLSNNPSENIHNNDSNRHLFDAEVCDTSVQNLSSATKIECPTSPTRVLIKQEHCELEHYRKLFISNFDEDIGTEELYYYFLQFGKIERTINIRKHKARSKYIGYIIIFNNSDSIISVQISEPHVFYNKTLKLYFPKKDGCEPEEFCKLFVGNLNSRTTENDLGYHFQRWGKIMNCVVERESQTNISKCYGSVTFKFYSSMNEALVHPYHRIRGRNLKVDLFQEREQTLWGINLLKHVHSTKITQRKAKGSSSEVQKVDKKSSSSNKFMKKEFLSERDMLNKIEQSRVLKPVARNYKLNEFDGAGVNIFKNLSIRSSKS